MGSLASDVWGFSRLVLQTASLHKVLRSLGLGNDRLKTVSLTGLARFVGCLALVRPKASSFSVVEPSTAIGNDRCILVGGFSKTR